MNGLMAMLVTVRLTGFVQRTSTPTLTLNHHLFRSLESRSKSKSKSKKRECRPDQKEVEFTLSDD